MKHLIDEHFLDKIGAKYTYVKSIPIKEIDIKTSIENPARMYRKLNKQRAEQYAYEMIGGDEFPAIVLLNHEAPHDGMKWIIATGVHRTDARIQAGITETDAYLVTEPDAYRREVIIRMLNITVGEGMNMEEIFAHLLWLNEHHGTALAVLAKEWNVKLGTLTNAAAEQRARFLARRTGYNFEQAKVGSTSIIYLGGIHSDPVFDKAVEFVCTYPGIRVDEVKDMTGEIRKSREESAQLAIVEKFKEAADKRLAKGRSIKASNRPSKITKIARWLKTLSNQLDCPMKDLHVASYDDMQTLLYIIENASEAIKRLRGEAERVQRMSQPPSQAQPDLRKGGTRPDTRPEARP